MKSESIFRILNARNLGLILPNIFLKTKSLRKTMLCVWWDQESVIYYELLKSGETVNAHRYHQQLVGLNCTVLCVKKGRIIGKDMTS